MKIPWRKNNNMNIPNNKRFNEYKHLFKRDEYIIPFYVKKKFNKDKRPFIQSGKYIFKIINIGIECRSVELRSRRNFNNICANCIKMFKDI